jgi:hypothetical protein
MCWQADAGPPQGAGRPRGHRKARRLPRLRRGRRARCSASRKLPEHERHHRCADLAAETSTDSAKAKKHAFELNKLSKRLHRQVGQAIGDFNMIEEGDKVMVCLSGGKDSYALLDILLGLQQRAPVKFTLVAVNLDQKQPGFPAHVLPAYLEGLGMPNSTSRTRTPTASSRSWCPRARPCAACARGCGGASSTGWPVSWAPPRSRWATTATTSW